ncbi:hypothetical protein Pyrde_0275 [Pyrodictium delaneyi]|uniref:Uncharacterized protein n=1 Tax=Pyrodictium delaneyi TaxID=1273541 RepID=A0A0P0N1A3_9CREN|nr:hypothetical protein [Pyrodictium delaneyi]ALL00325.1 hypothetical protein Pyrde_0275 [Pyrodictium delaneyi]OWJ54389.1 hypothetical protein Pdsh_07920 [Pyrodictium delaneyi]
MPSRLGIIALVGILAAVGIMAGYTFRYGQPQVTSTEVSTLPPSSHGPGMTTTNTMPAYTQTTGATTTTTATTIATSMGPHGPGNGMMQMNSTIQAACITAGLNDKPIGQNIKWLFDNHDIFNYKLMEFPENKTLIWIISAPDKAALETLVSHVMQMECVVEHGGNPRPFDPLFRVDAAITSKYVHTEIKWLNDTTVKIVKVANNDCAFEVIKLHAQVVKGFFDTGRIEAQKIHEVPEYALELCKTYLGDTS